MGPPGSFLFFWFQVFALTFIFGLGGYQQSSSQPTSSKEWRAPGCPRPGLPAPEAAECCFLCLLLELILGVEISPVLIFFLFLYTNSEDPYLPLIFIHCIIRNDSILAR